MEEVTIKKVVIHYSDGSTETIGKQEEQVDGPTLPVDYSTNDFFNQMWNQSFWNPMKWFK
jgi:hypothetical protein